MSSCSSCLLSFPLFFSFFLIIYEVLSESRRVVPSTDLGNPCDGRVRGHDGQGASADVVSADDRGLRGRQL